MSKPFAVSSKEFGRGKASVKRFATLEEASKYVQDYWQGADYVDGNDGFHTDYSTFTLTGFTLKDIGQFSYDDGCREYRFNVAPVAADAVDVAKQEADLAEYWKNIGIDHPETKNQPNRA